MIFGIGFGRTGTRSLAAAMHYFGFRSSHFVTVEQFNSLDASYDFVSDHPVAENYRTLDAQYPGSKFILTIRPTAEWLDSWTRMLALQSARALPIPSRKFQYREKAYGQSEFDPTVWEEAYTQHNQEVQDYFQSRPDDLLVFEDFQWEPLCAFVGKDVPEINYPQVKDRNAV
jgi:hypothetical protein